MPRKQFRQLLRALAESALVGVFGALFFLVLATWLSGCDSGPSVDVCLVYPEKSGLICVDQKQQAYFLTYEKAAKYVAFSPQDAQKIIESCGISGGQKADILAYYKLVDRLAEAEASRYIASLHETSCE